jgi:hypothetical protein
MASFQPVDFSSQEDRPPINDGSAVIPTCGLMRRSGAAINPEAIYPEGDRA